VVAALVAALRGELAGSRAALARALEDLAQARERIAELEARLRHSPRNSSRPPSSQGLDKLPPRPRSLRTKTGRKQDGHEGSTLAQVARPDRELRHEPGRCGWCGAGLAGRPVTGVERRQVFDLPQAAVAVTEHQLIERECRCGQRARAAAPPGADGPVQYGPRIAAVIVYLSAGRFLSKQRTAQALAELFGVPCSSGTVAALTARAAGRLGGFLEHVRSQIAAHEVAGFDETGFRVQGRLHWVHCARTGKYTLLMVHPKRGTEAMNAMGARGSFAGVAVHDAWAPYDTYTGPEHQRCCAHAPRELQAVTDAAPAAQWCWAAQAAEALTAMQDLVREAIRQGGDAVDPAALAAQVRLYRSAVLAGASQAAARSGPLMKKHHALARRLLGRQDDYLRFTTGFRAPPDNNGSERDIRMAKLRQQVSGCLRTLTGARQFCAIRSYLSSAAKHGIGFFDALVMLTKGEPWMPAST
jgi:transposase